MALSNSHHRPQDSLSAIAIRLDGENLSKVTSKRLEVRYNAGELKVILINHGLEPYKIRRGDRIAQAVLSPVVMASWLEVHELDKTVRGEGGFGSTGFGEAEVEPIRKD